jgi:hypothetical protein
MDTLEIAIASGMQATLDGRVGTEEYRSVHGSLQALRRFAEAVLIAAVTEKGQMKKSFLAASAAGIRHTVPIKGGK